MDEKQPKYIEGVGWRYDTEHSMTRRMAEHDYQSRSIYMITMTVTDRMPLLGSVRWTADDAHDACLSASRLGAEVERCWYEIPEHYPEVKVLAFQLMPDHVHGLLFVKHEMEVHIGKVLKGFKIGCSRAWWSLSEAAAAGGAGAGAEGSGPLNYNSTHNTAAVTHNTAAATHNTAAAKPAPAATAAALRTPLFTPGYQDSILMGKGQLERMFQYMADNPRRLAIRRLKPDLFRVVAHLTVAGMSFAAIGNRWLLDRPQRMQVRCHNNTTPENLRLIERQKAYFLDRGRHGGVIVSPCISAGEKEVARAALDAGVPLVVILENGFPPMYKPPGKYFEACAKGQLLMLAPWPYHMERRTITRAQCLALNDMACRLSTEPWTPELEEMMKKEDTRP